MEIKSVCVIGAGRMGRQIGLQSAICGFDARVYDTKPEILEDMRKWEDEYLAGRIAKGRMTEEQVAGIKERFHICDNLAVACDKVDLVIEAVFENADVKRSVFAQVNQVITDDTIIATNSSYMVSSMFVNDVRNPKNLCNLHFYNPALVLKFVELVQGPHCCDEAAQAVYDYCIKIKKTPVWQKKEIAGFAGNYILANVTPYGKEYVAKGFGPYYEADIIQEEGIGRKQGVFHLMDLTGIELAYTMGENKLKETGEAPLLHDIISDLYNNQRYGIKNGHGFYDYKEPFTQQVKRDRSAKNPDAKVIKSALIIGGNRGEAIAAEIAEGGIAAKYVSGADFAEVAAAAKGVDFIMDNQNLSAEETNAFFKKLAEVADEDAILACSSLAFVSSAIIDGVKNPYRVLSAHFCPLFNNKLVEIVKGDHTCPDVAGAVFDMADAIGKRPALTEKEIPEYGYFSNQTIAHINEAAHFLADGGYCTLEEVDIAMEEGLGFKMGLQKLLNAER